MQTLINLRTTIENGVPPSTHRGLLEKQEETNNELFDTQFTPVCPKFCDSKN